MFTPSGRPDPQDGFTRDEEMAFAAAEEARQIEEAEMADLDEFDDDYYGYDDGQPDEYTEWQDLYGGDDWDHGQYDEAW